MTVFFRQCDAPNVIPMNPIDRFHWRSDMARFEQERMVPLTRWLMPIGQRLICSLLFAAVSLTTVHAEQVGPFAGLQVDPSLERYSPKSHATGGFKVQGSDTMHALMRRLVADFQARQPKVSIELRS